MISLKHLKVGDIIQVSSAGFPWKSGATPELFWAEILGFMNDVPWPIQITMPKSFRDRMSNQPDITTKLDNCYRLQYEFYVISIREVVAIR